MKTNFLTSKNQKIIISGNFLKTVRIEEEWYEDVNNPEALVNELKKTKGDIFTFWQRPPHNEPKYEYDPRRNRKYEHFHWKHYRYYN